MQIPQKILHYLSQTHPRKYVCDDCIALDLDMDAPIEEMLRFFANLPHIRRLQTECSLCKEVKFATAVLLEKSSRPEPGQLH